MKKKHERDEKQSTFNKALDDEPLFVLRGQDKLAPALISLWCEMAERTGTGPSKIAEARHIAEQMVAWSRRKFPD